MTFLQRVLKLQAALWAISGALLCLVPGWLLTDVLRDVVRHGTAVGSVGSRINFPAGGKTGPRDHRAKGVEKMESSVQAPTVPPITVKIQPARASMADTCGARDRPSR